MLQFHLQYCDLDLLKTLSTCNINITSTTLGNPAIALPGEWPNLPFDLDCHQRRLALPQEGTSAERACCQVEMAWSYIPSELLQLRPVVCIAGLAAPESAIYAMDRSLGNIASCHIYMVRCTPKKYHPLHEWWRFDDGAPWKAPENRPGPTPFKDCERPFDIIPGGSSCERIRPDIVHTFHIGFGTDLVASMVVWLVRLGLFDGAGNRAFDDKLKTAYSTFREYCHVTHRFTACDQWCIKKLGMASNACQRLAIPFVFCRTYFYIYSIYCHIYTVHML